MAMALVLNMRLLGRNLLRSIVLVPWAMSPVAVGILWGWMFNGDYGTFNAAAVDLGITRHPIHWLGNGTLAFNLVALVHVWNQAPLTSLLILAGLQSMPENLHRAARIDGAGAGAALLSDHAALAAADAAAGDDPDQHQLDHGLRPVLDHDEGRPGQRHHGVFLDGLCLRLPVLPVRRGRSDPLRADDRLPDPGLDLSEAVSRPRRRARAIAAPTVRTAPTRRDRLPIAPADAKPIAAPSWPRPGRRRLLLSGAGRDASVLRGRSGLAASRRCSSSLWSCRAVPLARLMSMSPSADLVRSAADADPAQPHA